MTLDADEADLEAFTKDLPDGDVVGWLAAIGDAFIEDADEALRNAQRHERLSHEWQQRHYEIVDRIARYRLASTMLADVAALNPDNGMTAASIATVGTPSLIVGPAPDGEFVCKNPEHEAVYCPTPEECQTRGYEIRVWNLDLEVAAGRIQIGDRCPDGRMYGGGASS